MRVAVSNDDGVTWTRVALLELGDNKHYYHYPTMHQDGCRLLVVYSVMQVYSLQSIHFAPREWAAGGVFD